MFCPFDKNGAATKAAIVNKRIKFFIRQKFLIIKKIKSQEIVSIEKLNSMRLFPDKNNKLLISRLSVL